MTYTIPDVTIAMEIADSINRTHPGTVRACGVPGQGFAIRDLASGDLIALGDKGPQAAMESWRNRP